MPTAMGFCPQPPLLVPELAAGAAPELDPLRAACAEVVRRLSATSPDRIAVLGAAGRTGVFGPGARCSLAGYGVPVTVPMPGAPPGSEHDHEHDREHDREHDHEHDHVPLALTIGAWLLAGVEVPCTGFAVGPDADPAEIAAGVDRGRTAVLVMGDGSACRSERAPGYVDGRAAAYDAGVAAALRDGDAAALRDLDPALGAELMAAGVPAWRVAGSLGGRWSGQLLHDDAPYGVGYLAAVWT